MDDYNNKSICILPWINLSTDTDGSIRLCCISDAYIKKDNGDNYNLGYDKVEDILNSTSYKKIRQDMIDGKPIQGCETCYKNEKNNGRSERQLHNRVWEADINFRQKYKQSLKGEDISETVQYFDLRFGNLCNLSCRSCNPGSSSQFNKELKELQHTKLALLNYQLITKELNDWYNTEVFQQNITNHSKNIFKYYITGGEPTLIDKNYEILQQMVDSGDSKHIVLVLNSNMTNTKKDFYAFFKHFKKVILMASIDGIDAMQEYLRYPSNWKQISGNLYKLVNMELTNLTIMVSPVIQKTNLGYITELFEFLENINKEHNKLIFEIHPINLIEPTYLDLRYLPLEYKISCWEKIDAWVNTHCKYQGADFYKRLKAIKNSCFEEVDYHQNLVNYFEFTDIFDNHRNEQLADINPELDSLRR
jgi:organic radical activating enzyme